MESDCFSNISFDSRLPANPFQGNSFSMFEMMQQFNDVIMNKFLWIGMFALAYGLWTLFKDPNKEDDTRVFITDVLNMACIVAGITGIVLYISYKYDLVKI